MIQAYLVHSCAILAAIILPSTVLVVDSAIESSPLSPRLASAICVSRDTSRACSDNSTWESPLGTLRGGGMGDTTNEIKETFTELSNNNRPTDMLGTSTSESLGKEFSSSDEARPHNLREAERRNAVYSSLAEDPLNSLGQKRNKRRASDFIAKLLKHRGMLDDESYELRELIAARAQQYMDDLMQAGDEQKVPHPKKLLHFVAPKIPAIKHSPDFMLRVQTSRGDIDAGVAACAIGTLAWMCELYDKARLKRGTKNVDDGFSEHSVGSAISKDRRFEQLVECVLSGLDVNERAREDMIRSKAEQMTEGTLRDIEEVLDEENTKVDEGLSVQDACRAAWGIAVLSGYHLESISGENTNQILRALSSRVGELLLARLQLLRKGDSLKEPNGEEDSETLQERLDLDAEALAEDIASAMWTFACVKACTGVRSVRLFETCCSILCQNPTELRERAQSGKVGLDGFNFELNDVVERLARSEEGSSLVMDDGNSALTRRHQDLEFGREKNVSIAAKDALLDWLSPNEVTDVLWGLALHGSTENAESKDELTLSETAAAFREIAFDRLVGWLRQDLSTIVQVGPHRKALSGIDGMKHNLEASPDVRDHGPMIVEVVDAVSLLASSPRASIESIMMKDEGTDLDLEQVEVVDAASLLASTREGETPLETETEVIVSTFDSSHPRDSVQGAVPSVELAPDSCEEYLRQNENNLADSSLPRSGKLSFSPHDLCSIAWAVTDLRDPLRFRIVELVTQIFASIGKVSIENLVGGDLSNLAWAISRSSTQGFLLAQGGEIDGNPMMVTRWAVEAALDRLGLSRDDSDHDDLLAISKVLEEFQPPELGRFVWSLSRLVCILVDPADRDTNREDAMKRFTMLALCTAGSDVSMFGTEDLARIAWSFLELRDTEDALSEPIVAESLGRILSVIESSLLLWENGVCESSTSYDSERLDDSVRFSTFLGKSRFSLPLLNQRIGSYEGDDDDFQPYSLNQKGTLPLLRDLSVDPSTICKLASAFSLLGRRHPHVNGGWTLVKVAVRLLTSKSGQLMKQCSMRDVIRLCYACATIEEKCEGRDYINRLFARRVVQVLNDAFDSDCEENVTAAARLSKVSPWEMATLIWALGELGVRHHTKDENRRSAYRRLRLVSDGPLLTDDQVKTLSASSAATLGLVSMNMLASDPGFLATVLRNMEDKISRLIRGDELCEVADSLCHLKCAIDMADGSIHKVSPRKSPEYEVNSSSIETFSVASQEGPAEDSVIDRLNQEEKSAAVSLELMHLCNQRLSDVVQRSRERMEYLSAYELRKLLLICAVLPFQADDLITAIEEQVDQRIAHLQVSRHRVSVQAMARQAANASLDVCAMLSNMAEVDSPVTVIKNGIRSLFRPSEEVSEEQLSKGQDVASGIHHTAALIADAADRLERVEVGTRVDADTVLRRIEEGAVLELGRCRELMASYRRINFQSGVRQSRYDRERRQDIGKRVLSRLFPP